MDHVIGKIPLRAEIAQLFLREVAVCHSAFFHDPPGGFVPGEEGGIHGVHPFFSAQVFEKAPDRLGCAAPVPVCRADPVADLASAVLLVKIQDDPDQPTGVLKPDREQVFPPRVGGKIKALQRLRILADKGLEHLSVVGYVLIIIRLVLLPDRVDDQSFGFQLHFDPSFAPLAFAATIITDKARYGKKKRYADRIGIRVPLWCECS